MGTSSMSASSPQNSNTTNLPSSNHQKATIKVSRLYFILGVGLLGLILQYARLYHWFHISESNIHTTSITLDHEFITGSNHRLSPMSKQTKRQIYGLGNTNVSFPTSRTSRIDPKFRNLERYQGFPTLQELKSSCPPRLELLHIPKTAGTAIERCASWQANVAWGSCKFHFNYKNNKEWSMCLGELQPVVPFDQWPDHIELNNLWHYPLQYLEQYTKLPANPYHHVALPWNSSNSTTTPTNVTCRPQDQEIHFFTVVRNPYDRIISEYYYRSDYFKDAFKQHMHSPRFMNNWIGGRMKDVRKNIRQWDTKSNRIKFTHWIPQSEFIMDAQGNRRVRHVLKYESLDIEFPKLMERYGLNISLQTTFLSKSGGTQARMGPQHLTLQVRNMLESYFANDFALGPYPFYDGPAWEPKPTNDTNHQTKAAIVPNDFHRFQSCPTTKQLQSKCPPRLLLLHIPKTGGSTIEKAAFEQGNLAWGCCHFHLKYGSNPWTGVCPLYLQVPTPLDQWPNFKKMANYWHYPLHWLESNQTLPHALPSNPYYNVVAGTNLSTTACPVTQQDMHFFAVVRNPYEKAISEFYFQASYAIKRKVHVLEDRGFMNRWINDKLERYQAVLDDPNLGWSGQMLHWLPQSVYIFDDQGNRRVRHVLRFENLTAEFNELMRGYNLNLTLPATKSKSGNVPEASRLGPAALNKKVRARLEQQFASDFALGNYSLYRPGAGNATAIGQKYSV